MRVATIVFALMSAFAGCIQASNTTTDDLTQPLKVSPDHHYLMQPNGQPFFWLADTAWELFHRLDRDETEIYLRDRATKGFNVIQAVATGKLDFDGLKSPNRYGEVPFNEGDPSNPNIRYFQHIDWVIERAARYGIRIALLPAWGAFYVTAGPARIFEAANAETYGRWLGNRYRGKGIIWVLGGDINPISDSISKPTEKGADRYVNVVDYRSVYDSMARGIMEGEGGHAFITYHPTAGNPSGTAMPRMSLYFGDRTWFSMSMLESGHLEEDSVDGGVGNYTHSGSFFWNATFNYLPIGEEYAAVPARPVVDGETRYEDHPILTAAFFTDPQRVSDRFWRAHDARNAAYHSLFAGAAGHTYGHFDVWDFYTATNRPQGDAPDVFADFFARYPRVPWQTALHAQGAGQMRFAKALLLSRPYFSRIPDQTLIVGAQGSGDAHVSATRDQSGSYAMAYLPHGRAVTLNLSKLAGDRCIGWWFNPRTGRSTKVPGSFRTKTKILFVPPTKGDDEDWVLVLDSEASHFRAPGSRS